MALRVMTPANNSTSCFTSLSPLWLLVANWAAALKGTMLYKTDFRTSVPQSIHPERLEGSDTRRTIERGSN